MAPDFLPRLRDIGRRRPSANPPSASPETPQGPRSASAVFPTLHRLDLTADMPPARTSAATVATAVPLLTLLLTSTSFLETIISDISDGAEPLYTIETRSKRTFVHRKDFTGGVLQVCCVRWRGDMAKDITVQFGRERQKAVDTFLRFGSYFTSRKFLLPNYPHTLKWRRVGNIYNLTSATSKKVIATLEPAILSAAPRLKLFETLTERDETRPQSEHRGVPLLLIDYLVVTALLLVTDVDEWRNYAHLPPREANSPTADSCRTSLPPYSGTHEPTTTRKSPTGPTVAPSTFHDWHRLVEAGPSSAVPPPSPSDTVQSPTLSSPPQWDSGSTDTGTSVQASPSTGAPTSDMYGTIGASTSASASQFERDRLDTTTHASSSLCNSSTFKCPLPFPPTPPMSASTASRPLPCTIGGSRPISAGGRPLPQPPSLIPPVPNAAPTITLSPLHSSVAPLSLHSAYPSPISAGSSDPDIMQDAYSLSHAPPPPKLAREYLRVENTIDGEHLTSTGESRTPPPPHDSFDLPRRLTSASTPPGGSALAERELRMRHSVGGGLNTEYSRCMTQTRGQLCESLLLEAPDELPPPAYDSINWGQGRAVGRTRPMTANAATTRPLH